MTSRIALAVVIGVVAIGAIIVYADRHGSASASTPTLSGTTLEGASFDLASTRGKPTVINFFGNWCPYCKEEAPELEAFKQAHPEVTVIGVANDSRSGAAQFVQDYKVDFPVVMDEPRTIAEAWGVDGWPTTVFLDAKGNVRDTLVGAATRDMFEASLQKALQSTP